MLTIRAATPHDGPLLRQVMTDWGQVTYEWLDWSQAYPYWLIGEWDGVVAGVVMVNPGVPFGRVDLLTVNPALPHAQRAIVCHDLAYAGAAACQQHGSQAILSFVDTQETSWRAIAERRGWVVTGTGSYLLKRCT